MSGITDITKEEDTRDKNKKKEASESDGRFDGA
jgi:hypothetical protein